MKAGIFLKSTPLLDDSIFENTVIYIAELNAEGAVGFIVNQPYPRKLNELEEFKNAGPFPIHLGGPMDQEHLFFLHSRPDVINGGEPVDGGKFLGGDFKQAVEQIRLGGVDENDVMIFLGYCGWDKDELEAEIAEGSWEITSGKTV